MKQNLTVYLHDLTTLTADWVFTLANGQAASVIESGTLSDLVNKNTLSDIQELSCILPAELVHYAQLNIPAKSRQRALQAIPFALEDQLAEEIDDIHFALGKAEKNIYPVACIKHDRLQGLTDAFDLLNLKLDKLYIDAICLPISDNSWSILMIDNRLSIRLSNGDIINTDADNFEFFYTQLIKQNQKQLPEQLIIYCKDETQLARLSLSDTINITTHYYGNSPLKSLALLLNSPQSFNLLQGRYQRRKQRTNWWQPWKLAAVLATIVICFELINTGISLSRLEKQNDLITKDIDRIYQSSFPESKKIINARVQMEGKLKKLRKSGGQSDYSFTELLIEAGPLIAQVADSEIKDISYRNKKLNLEVTLNQLSTAESLKNQLNQLKNIKAELASVSAENKQVLARIQLEAKP